MRRPERQRLDHSGEAARIVLESEARGHIRGATRPRLVPRDDRELVGQRGDEVVVRIDERLN